jgi:hypothetical protein
MSKAGRRLRGALAAYGVLGIVAWITLGPIGVRVDQDRMLAFVLILLGGMALRSWVHFRRERTDEAADESTDEGRES